MTSNNLALLIYAHVIALLIHHINDNINVSILKHLRCSQAITFVNELLGHYLLSTQHFGEGIV